MRYNERKIQSLEVFAEHAELRPGEWAAAAGFYPIRAAWTYLLRLHRLGLLDRRRDYKHRVVYKLSRRGADKLLRHRRGVLSFAHGAQN